MKAYIYKISSEKTSDFYIGSTIQDLKNRFKTHRSNAKLGHTKKLYDCMREHSIENFVIEMLEEFEIDNKRDPKLGEKELEYYNKLNPSLNMISPKILKIRSIGRVYCVSFIEDKTMFYIGSTERHIKHRLSCHKSASIKGVTPFYQFMKEKGNENFEINCLEDNIPIEQLIIRENYWISHLKPPLNKNINLCLTEKERDRLKYIKNREKRLKQVSERHSLKKMKSMLKNENIIKLIKSEFWMQIKK